MVAFKQKHITAIRRGRSFLDDARFTDRLGGAIDPDEFDLRCRIVVKKLFILRVLQKIFERRSWSDAPQILLDDRPGRHLTAHGSRASIRGNSSAQQTLAIA